MTVGENLKVILNHKQMTIRDLSKKSGVSTNTIYGISSRDRKNITPEVNKKLSEALELSVTLNDMDNAYDYIAKETISDVKRHIFDEVIAYSNLSETDKKQLLEKFNLKIQYEADFDIKRDMVKLFSSLNEKGQAKAIEQIELLARIPEYQADNMTWEK
jgi:transcriptional regulator with XRE-family HTH domain